MTRDRSGSWLRFPAVAVLCAGLAACGGDSDTDGAAGSGDGAPDEFCERLFDALDAPAQEFQDDGSQADELFAAVAQGLREIRPDAPAAIAEDFDVFIEYYETAAAGPASPELAQRMEEFAGASNAVFGHCAMSPVLPPAGP